MADDGNNHGAPVDDLALYQATAIAEDHARALPPPPVAVKAFEATVLAAPTVPPAPAPVAVDPPEEDVSPLILTPVAPAFSPAAVEPIAPPPVPEVSRPPLQATPVSPVPSPSGPTPPPVSAPQPTEKQAPSPVSAPVANKPVVVDPAPKAVTPAPSSQKPTPAPSAPVVKPTLHGTKPHAPKPLAPKPHPKAPERPAPKLGHNYTITSLADPHVTAADGRRFDNSQVGKFVLAESKLGDLKVETDNKHLPGDKGVWQTQAAIQAGKNVIKYDAASNVIHLNGRNIPFKPGETIKLPGGGSITTSNDVINGQPLHRVQVHTDKGDTLSFLNFQHFGGGRYLDVALNISGKRAVGEVSGIGGVVGKNELATRDGKATNDVERLANSWRVTNEDNLFNSTGGLSRLHQAAGFTPEAHRPPVQHEPYAQPASHRPAPAHLPHAAPHGPEHHAPQAPERPAPVRHVTHRAPTAPLHHPFHHR